MTNPQEKRHAALAFACPGPALPTENPVSDIEFLSLCALLDEVTPDGERVATYEGSLKPLRAQLNLWAAELAEPLATASARTRHLARDAAILRVRIAFNDRRREVMLGSADPGRAMLLDRILQTDAHRLEVLLRSLREEQRGGARTVQIGSVTFNDRAQVNVLATQGVPDAVPR